MKSHKIVSRIVTAVAIVGVGIGTLFGCSAVTQSHRFTVTSEAGIDGKVQIGKYAPVSVAVTNSGKDFTGTVQIIAYNGEKRVMYEKDISVAANATKNVSITIPITEKNGRYNVRVVNKKGDVLYHLVNRYNAITSITTVNVGVLTDDYPAIGYMDSVQMYNNDKLTTKIVELSADDFGSDWRSLDMLDVIVVTNYSTDQLTDEQIGSLRYWVENGGCLVSSTGSTASKTQAKLDGNLYNIELGNLEQVHTTFSVKTDTIGHITKREDGSYGFEAPDQIGESDTFDEWLHQKPEVDPNEPLTYEAIAELVPYVEANITQPEFVGTSVYASNYLGDCDSELTYTLYEVNQSGSGYYIVTAFDFTQTPLPTYMGNSLLFLNILEDSIASTIYTRANEYDANNSYYSSYNPSFSHNSNLNIDASELYPVLAAPKAPSLLLYTIILAGYVLAVPITFGVLRKKKKNIKMWVAYPVIVVGATLVIFVAGFTTRILRPELGVAKVTRLINGRMDEATLVSVVMPNDKLASVSFKPNYQFEFYTNDYYGYYNNSSSATINLDDYDYSVKSSATSYEVRMKDHMALDYEKILLRSNSEVPGSFDTDIYYKSGTLTGTITNNLDYDLQGAYVAIDNAFFFVGDIKRGETVTLDGLTMETASTTTLYTYGYHLDMNAIAKKSLGKHAPNAVMNLLFGSLNGKAKQYQIQRETVKCVLNTYNSYNTWQTYKPSRFVSDCAIVAIPDKNYEKSDSVQAGTKLREHSAEVFVAEVMVGTNEGSQISLAAVTSTNVIANGTSVTFDQYSPYCFIYNYDQYFTVSYNLASNTRAIQFSNTEYGDSYDSYGYYSNTFEGSIYLYNYKTEQMELVGILDEYNTIETASISLSEHPEFVENGTIIATYEMDSQQSNVRTPILYMEGDK